MRVCAKDCKTNGKLLFDVVSPIAHACMSTSSLTVVAAAVSCKSEAFKSVSGLVAL